MKKYFSNSSVLVLIFFMLMVSCSSYAANKSFANKKGKLPWPVDKGVKVGEFGKYSHPDVPSVMIDNHGIDIRVEPNTPVRAVFQGEVTKVFDVLGSTVVMIRHGIYITVYQNVESVCVKEGDEVKAKQTIGTVAKLSDKDTYELHFEVWKETTYMDPNLWLKKSKMAKMDKNKPLLDTYWVLKSVKGEDIPKCIVTPYIVFEANGKFSGNLGCNTFYGNYQCGKKKIKMEFEGATKKLCQNMKVEKMFLSGLHTEFTQYEIVGNTLILKDRNGEALRFFAGTKPE